MRGRTTTRTGPRRRLGRPAWRGCPVCAWLGSSGLPQLDAVALGIGDPAEPADAFHVLRLAVDISTLGPQLGEHRVEVADPEVDHRLLRAGPEVVGVGLERREHREAGVLLPRAVLVGL